MLGGEAAGDVEPQITQITQITQMKIVKGGPLDMRFIMGRTGEFRLCFKH